MRASENHAPITIEQLIVSVRNKEIGFKVLIQAILDANFFIACNDEALVNQEIILPMYVEIDGEKTVCVFTKKEWAEACMADNISVVKLAAVEWLKQHPVNYGLILNPNHDSCIKFSFSGIKNILKELD